MIANEVIMWKKKSWSELTQIQKTGIVVLGIFQIALLAVAEWDIHSRPEEEIRGNKWVWSAIALVNFVGPAAYFLFGRSRPGQKRVTLVE
jgi:hypothetical protein